MAQPRPVTAYRDSDQAGAGGGAAARPTPPALQQVDAYEGFTTDMDDYADFGDGEAVACWRTLDHADPPQALQPGHRFAHRASRPASNAAPPRLASLASVMSQMSEASMDEGMSDVEDCVMGRGYEAAGCWQADLAPELLRADTPALAGGQAAATIAAAAALGAGLESGSAEVDQHVASGSSDEEGQLTPSGPGTWWGEPELSATLHIHSGCVHAQPHDELRFSP